MLKKNVRVTSYVKGQAPRIQANTFILPHFFPYLHQNHATIPNRFPNSNKCKLQVRLFSRGQDVIPWDLLAEIDFFVLSYSLTLNGKKLGAIFSRQN